MIRSYRYPLYPTEEQLTTLDMWLNECRFVYNSALQHRKVAWEYEKRLRQLAVDQGIDRTQQKAISYFDQCYELAAFRKEYGVPGRTPYVCMARTLRSLDFAFKAFFRRCKNGENPGYPRFKSKAKYESLCIGRIVPKEVGRNTRSAKIRVPNLGLVKFFEYRPIKGQILSTIVRRDSTNKWFLCFQCDLGSPVKKTEVKTSTGIDLGLSSYLTLANGVKIDNPSCSRQAESRLVYRQQYFARRQKGSKARLYARLLLAKAYKHVSNQKLDHARKLASDLFHKYDLVAFEGLDIPDMCLDKRFSKPINDAAWGQFIHALTCKAEEAGKWCVPVNPRGTSQRCSSCKQEVKKDISIRIHSCSCGLVLDRDHNAALNILALGKSAVMGISHD